MPKKNLRLFLSVFVLWLSTFFALAQQDNTLTYGETVGGFLTPNTPTQIWQFEGNARDVLNVTVQRIGGNVTPRVRLLDSGGAPLITLDETTHDSQTLSFIDGLPTSGTYQLEVVAENALTGGLIDHEYSLTLTYRGTRRANVDEGRTPFPTLGSNAQPMPSVINGSPVSTALEVPVYGTRANVMQPDERQQRNRYILSANGFRIDWNTQGIPADRAFGGLAFLDNGIGFITPPLRNDEERTATLFTNSSFRFSIDSVAGIWTLELFAGTGDTISQTIVTDFYRVQSIQAVDGEVSIITTNNQRLVLSGPHVEITRRAQQGPNEEPVNEIRLEARNNGFERRIFTDLMGYHSLWYDYAQNETRVLYGDDARLFIRNQPYVDLFIRDDDEAPILSVDGGDITTRQLIDLAFYVNINSSNANKVLDSEASLDLENLGDVDISDTQIEVTALDQRRFIEPYANIQRLYTERGAIHVTRKDGTFRTLFTDSTDIGTPALPAAQVDTPYYLPIDGQYVPRGQNNLGANPQPTYPDNQSVFPLTPVNPTNGNFYYHVEDFSMPSHTLTLSFERHYNSQGQNLTPSYMLNSPTAYPFGQLGQGWRHTYQYDLDITNAPNGFVTLILPDGSRHRFRSAVDTANGLNDDTRLTVRWRSNTLRAWTLERDNGLLGEWRGFTPDGTQYTFDRVGRLQRITNADGQSLSFSTAPRHYVQSENAAGGFFVTEPYGRRLDIYTAADGTIQSMHDVFAKPTTYTYNNNQLINVSYIDSAQSATYTYDNGLMITFDDHRSPYHPSGQLDYSEDGRQRVLSFTENPNGSASRQYIYTYNDTITNGTYSVSRALLFNAGNNERREVWTYDPRGLLLSYAQVRPDVAGAGDPLNRDFEYGYEYNPTTELLFSYRQPSRSNLRFDYNDFGYLVAFTDPLVSGSTDSQYRLTYDESIPDRLRLAELRLPNGSITRYGYNDQGHLASETKTVRTGFESLDITTRYEHDTFGRLSAIIEPPPANSPHAEVRTSYEYDALGYLSQVIEAGINIENPDSDISRDYELQFNLIGQLLSVTDPRSKITAIEYYPDTSRIKSITLPDNNRIDYVYDANGNITQMDNRGQVTLYTYNDLQQLIAETQNLTLDGQPHRIDYVYTYNEVGDLLSSIDGLGRQTTYRYDEWGNPRNIAYPTGEEINYTLRLEDNGDTTRIVTRQDGTTIRYTYDTIGRLRTVVRINGNFEQTFRVDYNQIGSPISIGDTYTGRTLNLTYDLIGRITSTSVAGFTTRYTYDNRDNLIAVREPSSDNAQIITRYAYDPFGNLTHILFPQDGDTNQETWAQTLINNPNVTYVYDEIGNLIGKTEAPNTPESINTNYTYDDINRLTSILYPGDLLQVFGYDARGNLGSITSPNNVTLNATYDELNRLIQTTIGTSGRSTITYSYDDASNLTTIDRPDGRSIEYTYDDGDNIIVMNEGDAQLTLYDYDLVGRVASITNARGYTTLYNYDRGSDLTEIIDPLGNRQTYRWRSGRIAEYIDQRDQKFTFNVDALGRIETIRDFATEQNIAINTQLTYNDSGRITEVATGIDNERTRGLGTYARYTYAADGRILNYTETISNNTEAAYTLEYDALGRVVRYIQPPRRDGDTPIITAYTYDAVGRVDQITYGAHLPPDEQRTENFIYDNDGNVTAYRGTNGIFYTYRYDELGNLVEIVEAADTSDARTYLYSYDDSGRMRLATLPSGATIEYGYNFSGTVSRMVITSPDENAQPITYRYVYDELNNITQIELPCANDDETINDCSGEFGDQVVELTYDALGRPVRYVDAMDQVYAYTYDERSNLISVSDPLGSLTRYDYDARDRVQQVTLANGSVIDLRYNNHGDFNGLELPNTGTEGVVTGEQVLYEVDRNGALVSIQHNQRPESVIRFNNNAYGQPLNRIGTDGRQTNYSYNVFGDLINMSYPTGENINRQYDIRGYLTEINRTTPNENTLFGYDAFGRVVTIEKSGSETTRYSYDIMDNVIERNFGTLGRYIYTYDGFNRPIRVTFENAQLPEPAFVDITYNLNSWRTQLARSNGVETTITYDRNGRPTILRHRNAAERAFLDLFTYRYDAVGNVIRVERRLNDAETWTTYYSYDIIHQMIDERWLDDINKTRYKLNVRYDEMGNRVEEVRNNVRAIYIYDLQNQSRLVAVVDDYQPDDINLSGIPVVVGVLGILLMAHFRITRRRWLLGLSLVMLQGVILVPLLAQQGITPDQYTRTYEYDNNGRLTAINYPTDDQTYTINLTYDDEGRMLSARGTKPDGTTINTNISYDVLSNVQTWTAADNISYTFSYDQRDRIAMHNNDTNNSATTYYFTPFENETWMQVDSNGNVQWYLYDALGNIRRAATNDGQLDTSLHYEYNGFGELIKLYDAQDPVNTTTPRNYPEQLFAGGLYDPTLDMYIMGLRTYDPETNRFLQRDPVRQDLFGTLYTYARNRPTYFNDPQGTTPQHVFDATTAPDLAASLRPPAAPLPILPDFPEPPTVYGQQANENFRAIDLADQLMYEVNEALPFISPLKDNFYTLRSSTPTPYILGLRGRGLDTLTEHYTPDNQWRFSPEPDPTTPVDVFDTLRYIEQHINQSYVEPLSWSQNTDLHMMSLIPEPPTAPLMAPQNEAQQVLLDNLREVSLIAPITGELAQLGQQEATVPAPPPTRVIVDTPQPQAVPDVFTDYYSRFYANQKEFVQQLLSYTR